MIRQLLQKSFWTWVRLLAILSMVSACTTAPVEVIPATPTALPPTPQPTPQPTPEPISITKLSVATVQILAMVDEKIQWEGSGTIISSAGLILTNAHVARPSTPGLAALYNDVKMVSMPNPDTLVVAVVQGEDQPPVKKYLAEVAAVDGPLDLAVLKIVKTVDGESVNPEDLHLPFVEPGDSSKVQLGDTVRILGFPGIGGETITLTTGTVSGFESQDRVGDRAWIKTDSEIAPGNSGGLAVNDAGEIIGIPSMVVSGTAVSLGRLRSINLAKPLLEAVAAGDHYVSPYVVYGTGSEKFTLVTWAEDFDNKSCPIHPLERYRSGTLAVVSVWSYQGVQDGEDVGQLYFINDELVGGNIKPWSVGTSGDCFTVYLHNNGDPLPDGDYRFDIYAGVGLPLIDSAETTVGPLQSGDIKVKGQILDALTGNGIPQAVVVVLNPGVDIQQWYNNNFPSKDVYATARTDTKGYYVLPGRLKRQVEYPIVVGADGHIDASGFLHYGLTSKSEEFVKIELEPQ